MGAIVVLRWLDAIGNLDRPEEPPLMETVGWLVDDQEGVPYMIIASEYIGGTERDPWLTRFRQFTTVPRCLVQEVVAI